MTVDEVRQQALDEKTRQVLGEDDGATFMEMLAVMATRDDLAGLETRLDRRFEAIDRRFDNVDHKFEVLEHRFGERLERELRHMTNRMMTVFGSFLLGGMALAAGIARISV